MELNKKSLIFIGGIIISIVCTWLFARHIEWNVLVSALKESNIVFIVIATIIVMAAYILRTIRWQSIMLPVKKISFFSMFSATSIGYMANHTLPARAGEIIRPAMIGKKENVRITSTITTVVLERIFDLIGLLLFTVVTLAMIPLPDNFAQTNDVSYYESTTKVERESDGQNSQIADISFIRNLKKWMGVFAGGSVLTIAFLSAFVIFPEKISRILNKMFLFFPGKIQKRLKEFLESFISGLQILGNKKHMLWILLLTIIIWVLIAICTYVLGFSLHLKLPFAGSCLVVVCIGFAVALPQAPGYIGVFHLATQKALEVFNIEMVSSQSYAILLWAVSIIPITIIGMLFLWKEGLSFKDLSKFDK